MAFWQGGSTTDYLAAAVESRRKDRNDPAGDDHAASLGGKAEFIGIAGRGMRRRAECDQRHNLEIRPSRIPRFRQLSGREAEKVKPDRSLAAGTGHLGVTGTARDGRGYAAAPARLSPERKRSSLIVAADSRIVFIDRCKFYTSIERVCCDLCAWGLATPFVSGG